MVSFNYNDIHAKPTQNANFSAAAAMNNAGKSAQFSWSGSSKESAPVGSSAASELASLALQATPKQSLWDVKPKGVDAVLTEAIHQAPGVVGSVALAAVSPSATADKAAPEAKPEASGTSWNVDRIAALGEQFAAGVVALAGMQSVGGQNQQAAQKPEFEHMALAAPTFDAKRPQVAKGAALV